MAKRKNQFKLKIETDNAAFDWGSGPGEVSRLLGVVREQVMGGFTKGELHDTNGHYVGEWSLTLPKE